MVDAVEPGELVCEECMDGDHDACRRQAGYMHDDTPERCGCHQTGHRLDNRAGYERLRDDLDAVADPSAGSGYLDA